MLFLVNIFTEINHRKSVSIRVFFTDIDDSQDSRGPSFISLYHFHPLANIATLLKSFEQKHAFNCVQEIFIICRDTATLLDANSPNNNQLKISQFMTWKVKKGQKLMKLDTKVVQNL